MQTVIYWCYLVNAVLLIVHEIDSAYWKEWNLFNTLLPGSAPAASGASESTGPLGVNFFMLFHIPAMLVVLIGLVEVFKQTMLGWYLSLFLAACGLFAFCIHTWFIKRGHPEFRTPISQMILIATLLVSLVQAATTLKLLLGA